MTRLNCNHFFLLLFLLAFPAIGSANLIKNPSFEGLRRPHQLPSWDWQACHWKSSPDTQPGSWNVSLFPSDGESYITMVARGNDGNNANTKEDVHCRLFEPLPQGECYTLQMDLALSENFGHNGGINGWVDYNNPLIIKVWGSTTGCDRSELVWSSDPISNTNWQTYEVTVRPMNSDFEFLFFELEYVSLPEYFGNLCMDNFRLVPFQETPSFTERTVPYGEFVVLEPSAGTNYNWIVPEDIACQDSPSNLVVVTDSSYYEVEVIDSLGCLLEEHFQIWLALDIPNVFTPNNDQQNDVFFVQGLRPNSDFTVLNRWGRVVYQRSNYQNDWRGTHQLGGELPAGTYYYVLESATPRKTYNGTVQLLR
ncbi:MAG: gliding motility-associated C-terminal domain-containing protein [Salibacteraceae bacterium]